MKIKIVDIIEWEEDSRLIAEDSSHNGDAAIQDLIEEEKTKKIENGDIDGLPFICNADDIDEALDKYNFSICEYDYLKAANCDYEILND